MAVKNASFNYDQSFYVNGVLLSGVTDINGGYSIQESPINILGKGYTFPVRQGPLVGNFNINKYYIGKDFLVDYIDDSTISGSIHYDDKSFGFVSGYLTEYNISAGIGTVPSVQASITVHGPIGKSIDTSSNEPHPDIQIPNQGSISINTFGYENNRVTSFDYTVRVNRNPIYKIGSVFPVQVDRASPIIQEANFNLEINDYEVDQINEYLLKPKEKDLSISLRNPINNAVIQTFTINNARLNSQSISSSSEDVLTVSLSYNGYLNTKDL